MNINSIIDFKNMEANLKYHCKTLWKILLLHCEILHIYLKYKYIANILQICTSIQKKEPKNIQ